MKYRDVNERHIAGSLNAAPFGDAAPIMPGEARGARPVMVSMSDVVEERVTFLWAPYLARGKLALLVGYPDQGKTWVALDLVARCSRGAPFPGADDGLPGRAPCNAIFMTAEDGLGDTIKPRLAKLNADMSRVTAIEGKEGADGATSPITLSDIATLETAIKEKRPGLIVIDPLQAFLGAGVDMNRANEVRPVLSGLGTLAGRYGCTVLFITHLRKSAADRASYRVLGSVDFAATVRSILIAGRDPRTGDRALVQVKSNLAEAGPALGYTIHANGLTWNGPSSLTEADLLAPDAPSGPAGGRLTRVPVKLERAMGEIADMLGTGRVPSAQVYGRCAALGIAETTVREAAKAIGATQERESVPGGRRGEGRWFFVPPGPALAGPDPGPPSSSGDQRVLITCEDPLRGETLAAADQGACADTLVPNEQPDQDAARGLKTPRNASPPDGIHPDDQDAGPASAPSPPEDPRPVVSDALTRLGGPPDVDW